MSTDQTIRKDIINKYLNKNVLVRASAGSGKTSILVERVVALIESSDDVNISQIVAITFTKKAANEFYERLYQKLEKRSEPGFLIERDDPNSLLENPDDDKKRRDLNALKYIDTCFLGTIDSFIQTILNEHPIDANIPASSEIIDDEDFTTLLVDLYRKMCEENLWGLKGEALNFNLLVGASNFPTIIKTIMDNRNFTPKIDVTKLNDHIQQLNSQLSVLSKELPVFIKLIKEGRFAEASDSVKAVHDYLKDHEYIFKNINSTRYSYKSKYYYISNIKKAIVPHDIPELANLLSVCSLDTSVKKTKYVIGDKTLSLIHQIIYEQVMPFLIKAKDGIVRYLRENGKLTYKEALIYTIDLLRNDNQKEIDVIRNLQSKYKYFLLDECQDTDLLQYELFFRINANYRRPDWMNLEIDDGRLFLVGDRKQSIYHFRGADVRAYDIIEKLFSSTTKPIGVICDLTANFRSNDNLRSYFNSTFKNFPDLNHPDIPDVPKPPKKPEFKVYTYQGDKNTEPDNVAKMIKKIKNKCEINYHDFMLITSTKDNIDHYLSALNKAKIPCFCEGKVDFASSKALVSIINIFNYLIDPSDLYNRLCLLSSPLFNFDLTKTIDINTDLLNSFNNIDLNQSGSSILEQLINQQAVLERIGFEGFDLFVAVISLLKEEEMNGNINSFYDALLYLKGLLEDNDIERVTLLDNQIDAVHVANLHKVKGLESNVVIITKAGPNNSKTVNSYCDLGKNNIYYFDVLGRKNELTHNSPTLFSNAEDEIYRNEEVKYDNQEEQRLLYVAATRAKEMLLIHKPDKGASKWKALTTHDSNIKSISDISDPNSSVEKASEYVLSNDVINPDNVVVINYQDLVNPTYEVINASTIMANKIDREEDIIANSQTLTITIEKDKKDSLLFGTIVHKLMENIVISKTNKLDISICEQIAKEYDARDLIDQLKQVYQTIYGAGFKQPNEDTPSDIYQLIKDNECHAEVPYAFYKDKKINNGVIDLLVITPQEAIVIDYKTDIKEIDHTDQLEAYKSVVQTNYPDKVVKTFIYHIC